MLKKSAFFFLSLFITINIQAQNNTKSSDSSNFEMLKNLEIYFNLYKELNINYVEKLKHSDLIQKSIDGMLASLDPYTIYIPESEQEDIALLTKGQYGGVGALIHKKGLETIVSDPYEGFPAFNAGLRAGDRLLEIDHQSLDSKSVEDVSAMLKGQAGTTFKLKVRKLQTGKVMDIALTRETIAIPNVPYSGMFKNDIGYIKLASTVEGSYNEFQQAFLKLREEKKLKGLVIDLRGNGGGLLDEAVNIVGMFVKKGELIVATKGKLVDKNHAYYTSTNPVDLETPITVLVDDETASAAEILAGSIQDLDRGIIIGQRTFGKGLVQNIVSVGFNSEMKVTVAKYYTPSGRCIQAIDYSKKDANGESLPISDSLRHPFKTRIGRVVYDGAGIEPDISIDPRYFSNIASILVGRLLTFDYADKFVKDHSSLSGSTQFRINDSEYKDFIKFLSDKDYSYTTRSERAIEDFKKLAEREKYFDAVKSEYESLTNKMSRDKKDDLIKFKPEICEVLESEIVARYYYQKGRIESSLSYDKEFDMASSTLLNRKKYQDLLKPGALIKTSAIIRTDNPDQNMTSIIPGTENNNTVSSVTGTSVPKTTQTK
jgi:carboxyl-terminal processing protease